MSPSLVERLSLECLLTLLRDCREYLSWLTNVKGFLEA